MRSKLGCLLLNESINTIVITWGSFPLSQTLREMKRVLKNGGSILRIGACVEYEFTTHTRVSDPAPIEGQEIIRGNI